MAIISEHSRETAASQRWPLFSATHTHIRVEERPSANPSQSSPYAPNLLILCCHPHGIWRKILGAKVKRKWCDVTLLGLPGLTRDYTLRCLVTPAAIQWVLWEDEFVGPTRLAVKRYARLSVFARICVIAQSSPCAQQLWMVGEGHRVHRLKCM